jgi:hypothetical protein
VGLVGLVGKTCRTLRRRTISTGLDALGQFWANGFARTFVHRTIGPMETRSEDIIAPTVLWSDGSPGYMVVRMGQKSLRCEMTIVHRTIGPLDHD